MSKNRSRLLAALLTVAMLVTMMPAEFALAAASLPWYAGQVAGPSQPDAQPDANPTPDNNDEGSGAEAPPALQANLAPGVIDMSPYGLFKDAKELAQPPYNLVKVDAEGTIVYTDGAYTLFDGMSFLTVAPAPASEEPAPEDEPASEQQPDVSLVAPVEPLPTDGQPAPSSDAPDAIPGITSKDLGFGRLFDEVTPVQDTDELTAEELAALDRLVLVYDAIPGFDATFTGCYLYRLLDDSGFKANAAGNALVYNQYGMLVGYVSGGQVAYYGSEIIADGALNNQQKTELFKEEETGNYKLRTAIDDLGNDTFAEDRYTIDPVDATHIIPVPQGAPGLGEGSDGTERNLTIKKIWIGVTAAEIVECTVPYEVTGNYYEDDVLKGSALKTGTITFPAGSAAYTRDGDGNYVFTYPENLWEPFVYDEDGKTYTPTNINIGEETTSAKKLYKVGSVEENEITFANTVERRYTVKKVWQSPLVGTNYTSVEFDLMVNGEPYQEDQSIARATSPNWTASYTLPAAVQANQGAGPYVKAEYTVVETGINGGPMPSNIQSDVNVYGSEIVMTNSKIPDPETEVTVTVTKHWDGLSAQEWLDANPGKTLPTSLNVAFYGHRKGSAGTSMEYINLAPITPPADRAQIIVEKGRFDDYVFVERDILPSSEAGKWSAEVRNTSVDRETGEASAELHNTSKQEEDEGVIRGNKIWREDGHGNEDAIVPGADIKITLLYKGVLEKEIMLTPSGNTYWPFEFADLEHPNDLANYSIVEEWVNKGPEHADYVTYYEGFNVINDRITDWGGGGTDRDIHVRKLWSVNNVSSPRMELTLWRRVVGAGDNDWGVVDTWTIPAGKSAPAARTFTDLPREPGTDYEYKLTEVNLDDPTSTDWVMKYQVVREGNRIVIVATNLLNNKIDVPFSKTWEDDYQESQRTATYRLYRDGVDTGISMTITGTVTLAAFKDLPKYSPTGDAYRYEVREQKDGYTTTITLIDGVWKIVNIQNTTRVSATKKWDLSASGGLNLMELLQQLGMKDADRIYFTLYASVGGGPAAPVEGVSKVSITVGSLRLDPSPIISFNNMPTHDANGNLITYEIREDSIGDGTVFRPELPKLEGVTWVIWNTYNADTDAKLNVEKVFGGERDDADKQKRPDAIKFVVYNHTEDPMHQAPLTINGESEFVIQPANKLTDSQWRLPEPLSVPKTTVDGTVIQYWVQEIGLSYDGGATFVSVEASQDYVYLGVDEYPTYAFKIFNKFKDSVTADDRVNVRIYKRWNEPDDLDPAVKQKAREQIRFYLDWTYNGQAYSDDGNPSLNNDTVGYRSEAGDLYPESIVVRNLPVMNSDRTPIVFVPHENVPDGYVGQMQPGFTFYKGESYCVYTNTLSEDNIDAKIIKNWNIDPSAMDPADRPTELMILIRDAVNPNTGTSKIVTLTQADNWTAKVRLPLHYPGGTTPIEYEAIELSVKVGGTLYFFDDPNCPVKQQGQTGVERNVEADDVTYSYVFTFNNDLPNKTSFTGTKRWIGKTNDANAYPPRLTLTLMREKVGSQETEDVEIATHTLTSADQVEAIRQQNGNWIWDWSHEFVEGGTVKIPKYVYDDVSETWLKARYYVVEAAEGGFVKVVDSDARITNNQIAFGIKVTKNWLNDHIIDVGKPDVYVKLTINGGAACPQYPDPVKIVNNEAAFANLPTHMQIGGVWTKLVYTVTEGTMSGTTFTPLAEQGDYTVTYEGVGVSAEGLLTTNFPAVTEENLVQALIKNSPAKVNIPVEKIWNDAANPAVRPTVRFILQYRIGASGNFADMLNVTPIMLAPPATAGSFTGLPKYAYDASGARVDIYYRVREEILIDGTWYAIETGNDPVRSNHVLETDSNTVTGAAADADRKLSMKNKLILIKKNGDKVWANDADYKDQRPDSIQVKIQRLVWDPTANQYEPDIIFNAVGETQPITKITADSWPYEFTGLVKYDRNGVAYQYYVIETVVPDGYEEAGQATDAEDDVKYDMNLRNSFPTKKIEGIKNWSDNDDSNGLRPAAIRLEIQRRQLNAVPAAAWADYLVGQNAVTVTLVQDSTDLNKYTWVIDNLPKFSGSGATRFEWEYRVSGEQLIDGYGAEIQYGSDGSTTINNTMPLTDVIITKLWGTLTGIPLEKPNTTFTLFQKRGTADAVEYKIKGQTVSPTIDNQGTDNWTVKFLNLPMYYGDPADENKYEYYVQETGANGYTVTYANTMAGKTAETDKAYHGGTITNTPITGTIVVEKKWWRDNLYSEPYVPSATDEITYRLVGKVTIANTEINVYGPFEFKLRRDADVPGGWIKTHTGLPTHYKGEAIQYTITEIGTLLNFKDPYYEIDGTLQLESSGQSEYATTTISPDPAKVSIVIHNVWKLKTEVGKKIWNDNNDEGGIRPTSIALTLKRKTTAGVDSFAYELTLEENRVVPVAASAAAWPNVALTQDTVADPRWTYKFTGIDPMDAGRNAYTYYVVEGAMQGYTETTQNDDMFLVNKADTVPLSGTKTWVGVVDASKLPTVIAIEIQRSIADTGTWTKDRDEVVTLVKVSDNPLKYMWTLPYELPEYVKVSGAINQYEYRAVEKPITGFAYNNAANDFTNTHTPVNIAGTKYWDDQNNLYGLRPTSADALKLHLWRSTDGGAIWETAEVTGYTPTIMLNTALNTWSWSYSGLPSHEWTIDPTSGLVTGAKAYTYSVTESPDVPGYEPATYTNGSTLGDYALNGGKITNERKFIEIPVVKSWSDAGYDHLRPAKLWFKLVAKVDGVAYDLSAISGLVTVIELTQGTPTWTGTFSNLPKYVTVEGVQKEIQYSVVEGTYDATSGTFTPGAPVNYEASYDQTIPLTDAKAVWVTGSATTIGTLTITNTYVPTGLTGEKLWEGEGDFAAETRPDSIVLHLVRSYVDENNVTQSDKAVPSTEISYDSTVNANIVIAADATYGNKITVRDNWKWKFTNLPKTYASGGYSAEYTYRVVEEKVPSYDPAYSGNNVTNTLDTVPVSGTKTWFGTLGLTVPTKLEITLERSIDGGQTWDAYKPLHVGTNPIVVTVQPDGKWALPYELPAQDSLGCDCTYQAKEVAIVGFATTTGDTANDFINTHTPKTISGTKVWNDAVDISGLRLKTADELKAMLTLWRKAEGDANWTQMTNLAQYGIALTVAKGATDADPWTWGYTNLPSHEWTIDDTTGLVTASKEYTYLVREAGQVLNYDAPTYNNGEGASEASGALDGGEIINALQMIEIPVIKRWDDNSNGSNSRPLTVVFELKANGASFVPAKTITLPTGGQITDANTWTGAFANLPKYLSGALVDYSIVETAVNNYTETTTPGDKAAVRSDAPDLTLAITNKYDAISVNGAKTWTNEGAFAGETRPEQIQFVLKRASANVAIETVPYGSFQVGATHTWVTVANDGNGGNIITVKPAAADRLTDAAWVWKLDGLAPNDAQGAAYTYTIEEVELGNYAKTDSGMDVANALIRKPVFGTKTWNLMGLEGIVLPDKIQVTLERTTDGNNYSAYLNPSVTPAIPEFPATLVRDPAGGEFDYTWTVDFQLPKFDEGGDEYTYRAKEVKVDGFTYDGEYDEFENTIELIKLSGKKTFTGFDGLAAHYSSRSDWAEVLDKIRPHSVVAKLWRTTVQAAAGDITGEKVERVYVNNDPRAGQATSTADSANDWTWTFTNLLDAKRTYNADGTIASSERYYYFVTEEAAPANVGEQSERIDQFDPSRPLSVDSFHAYMNWANKLRTINIKITKDWKDEENRGGRPAQIEFTVEGTVGDAAVDPVINFTYVMSAGTGDTWEATIEGLPMYDRFGYQIAYTVTEVKLDNYLLPKYALIQHRDQVGTTFEIRFENALDAGNIMVTKNWLNDKGVEDFTRPQQLVFNLYQLASDAVPTVADILASGTVAHTATVDLVNGYPDDSWSAVLFENLLRRDGNGKLIYYYVQEESTPGYTAIAPTNVATVNTEAEKNTDLNLNPSFSWDNELLRTNIKVEKEWLPEEGFVEGAIPGDLKVTLTSKPVDVFGGNNPTVALSASNNWQSIFRNLPTHAYTGEGVDRVKVDLVYEVTEEELAPVFASSPATRTHSTDGQSEGIITDGQGSELKGYSFKFINTLEPISITVSKRWEDENEPAYLDVRRDVEFGLWRSYEALDGTGTEEWVADGTIAGPDFDPVPFDGLPKAKLLRDGATGSLVAKPYTYFVEEVQIASYERISTTTPGKVDRAAIVLVGEGSNATEFEIELVNRLLTTSIAITKYWDDEFRGEQNYFGLRKTDTELMFTLKRGSTLRNMETYEDANGDPYVFRYTIDDSFPGSETLQTVTGLPAYQDAANSVLWEYALEELQIGGYVIKDENITPPAGEGEPWTYEVTNAIERIDLLIRKHWMGDLGVTGYRGNSVAVTVQGYVGSIAEANKVFAQPLAYTIPAATTGNTWTLLVEGLLKTDADGNEIIYVVEETGATGVYTVTYANADHRAVMVGNQLTADITNTIETVTLNVRKIWDDGNNANKVRPANLSVSLLANGAPAGVAPLTLNEGNNWTGTFGSLPRRTAAGAEISYTVVETLPRGYTQRGTPTQTVSTVNGVRTITFAITNVPVTKDLVITKRWAGDEGYTYYRPAFLKFLVQGFVGSTEVYRNEYDLHYATSSSWVFRITDLPVYDAAGNIINYGVTEGINGVAAYLASYEPANGALNFTTDAAALADMAVTVTNTLRTARIGVLKNWQNIARADAPAVDIALRVDGRTVATNRYNSTTYQYDYTVPLLNPLGGAAIYEALETTNLTGNYSYVSTVASTPTGYTAFFTVTNRYSAVGGETTGGDETTGGGTTGTVGGETTRNLDDEATPLAGTDHLHLGDCFD